MVSLFAAAFNDGFEQGNQQVRLAPSATFSPPFLQLPVEHWHEAIGDPTLAILDRLVHNAHRLKLAGESMRRRAAITKLLDQTGQV